MRITIRKTVKCLAVPLLFVSLFAMLYFMGTKIDDNIVVRVFQHGYTRSTRHTDDITERNPANHTIPEPTTSTTTRRETCSKECMINKERITFLKKSCANVSRSFFTTGLDRSAERIVILKPKNHNVTIGFCSSLKTASNFMNKYLTVLSGQLPKIIPDPFTINWGTIPDKPLKEIVVKNSDFSTFKKTYNFMMARDPYTRLLSFYVDKIYTTNIWYWENVGKIALKIVRKGGVGKSCGHDVTFAEFIEHVTKAEKSGKHRDGHWYPVHKACYPCGGINYTYIVKLETMINDVREILHQTHLTSPINLTKVDEFNANDAIETTLERAFDTRVYRCISFDESLKRAWKVLQIRGVLSHDANFPQDAINHKRMRKERFREMIWTYRRSHPMTKQQKRAMKLDTLTKVYRTVPVNLLEDIKQIYGPDFTLFGYTMDPEYIRNRDQKSLTHWEPFVVD